MYNISYAANAIVANDDVISKYVAVITYCTRLYFIYIHSFLDGLSHTQPYMCL
jgi:hypothetical protein